MIYYVLIFGYFIMSFNDCHQSKKYKTKGRGHVVFYYLLPVFLLVALRDITMGPDTKAYFNTFYNIANNQSLPIAISQSHMEIGYITLNYIMSKIGVSYFPMQILISAFIYISIGIFLRKYSVNIGLSCFILITNHLMFGTMNTVRMWIVVAIILYSIPYLQERKFINFLLMVALASLFHFSAWIFIVIYPLTYIDLNYKWVIMIFAISTIVYFAAIPTFTFITSKIGMYNNYVETRFDTSDNIAVKITLAVNMCFFILATIKKTWSNENNSIKSNSKLTKNVTINKIAYAAMMLSVAISIIGLSNSIMSRVINYFSIFMLINIPDSVSRITKKSSRLLFLLLLMLLLLLKYFIVMELRPEWYCVTPYAFFFID